MSKNLPALLLLTLVCVGSFILALRLGAVPISFSDIYTSLSNQQSLHHGLIFELRLPRALAAFVCGGMLGLAGLLMQALIDISLS